LAKTSNRKNIYIFYYRCFPGVSFRDDKSVSSFFFDLKGNGKYPIDTAHLSIQGKLTQNGEALKLIFL